jgi:hypothetical protein
VRVPLSGTSHIALAFPVPSGDAGTVHNWVIITLFIDNTYTELLILQ